MRAYGNGKSVKVVDIFTIDSDNKGILLDTAPFQTADVGSEEVYMSSYHWLSGSTDEVIGHHDGAVVIDQKHPTRINGVEYFVGGGVIPSDCVVLHDDISTDKNIVYVANREIITDDYEKNYQRVGSFTGEYGYVGDIAFNKGVHYITNLNATSSTGYGDHSENGVSTSGFSEMILGGNFSDSSSLGLTYLDTTVSFNTNTQATSYNYLSSD